MGKRTFEMVGDADWYAGNYEFQAPIFVVTQHPPETPPKQNEQLTFTFVTEGIESTVAQATATAGDSRCGRQPDPGASAGRLRRRARHRPHAGVPGSWAPIVREPWPGWDQAGEDARAGDRRTCQSLFPCREVVSTVDFERHHSTNYRTRRASTRTYERKMQ